MRLRARSRFAVILTAAAAAGAAAGVAATDHAGPFSGLGTTQRPVAAGLPPSPLIASRLYPAPTAPTPLTQVIQVQDPPVYVAPPATQSPPPAPTAAPTATPTPAPPTPAPTASPSPTPCSDDGCGD